QIMTLLDQDAAADLDDAPSEIDEDVAGRRRVARYVGDMETAPGTLSDVAPAAGSDVVSARDVEEVVADDLVLDLSDMSIVESLEQLVSPFDDPQMRRLVGLVRRQAMKHAH
ncbi:MAG: hypothetical protein AAGA17_21810, partial [Actinomycetota bacterium]